jgi:hypothetical protein
MLAPVKRGVASTLGLLIALGVASTASAAALPSVLADGGTVTQGKNVLVRPKQIVYTGDSSGFLAGPGTGGRRSKPTKLKWSSWTRSTALGSGDDWLDNCKPSCAAGTVSQHAVTITLSRARTMLRLLVFTRMTVHYTHGTNPFTHKSSETFKLVRSGSTLFWNIPG